MRQRAERPRGPLARLARASRARASRVPGQPGAGGAGTENGTGAAAGAVPPRRLSRAWTGDRSGGQPVRDGYAPRARSCPRSRPSAADWSAMSPGGSSTRSRSCTRGPSAVMWRVRWTCAAEAARPRRVAAATCCHGKYLWLPADDDALLAHLGMSGQLAASVSPTTTARPVLREPDRELSSHIAGPVHLPAITAPRPCAYPPSSQRNTFGHLLLKSSASRRVRRHAVGHPRTSPRTRWSRPSTRPPSPPGCARAGPASSGRCSTRA